MTGNKQKRRLKYYLMHCKIGYKTGIFLLLLSMELVAQQQHFSFDYIMNNNRLTHNAVYDICQDAKDFMRFATETGLNRFDGQNIKQYHYESNHPHALPSRNIPTLLYTSDSILFVGTTYGLARYIPEKDHFETITYQGNPLDISLA